ncbi:hypothetical protein [Flavobacterium hercynium]|uniref:Uncharacterized protein n=1 Tax=Flavobacterium hercynium TaxID=387094 RepID=A0A226GZJ1_9FLAO|nr:hypothetical protein [Flavobacterium hercynium]OXA87345.1 hypothetical protein B0A66_16255 [Flavobacterium hercynium]SMP27141.1 hypothetical protein SAMN06265346_11042 [Flavobacterium hercynium]
MKRKITSYYLLVVIASSLLVSCSNDEEVTPVNSEIPKEKKFENVVLEKTTLRELGFNSIEEFLASEMVKEKLSVTPTASQKKSTTGKSAGFYVPGEPTFGADAGSNSGSNSGSGENFKQRELMTSAQVEQLHLGHSKIKELYKLNGNTPDGVTINKFTTRGAFSEYNLSDEYGWYTYVQAGSPKVTELDRLKEDDYHVYKFQVYNYSSVDDSAWRTFGYSKGTTISTSISFSTGLNVKGTLGVEGVASASVERTFQLTLGAEYSQSTIVNHEERYVATLPAHSKRTIYVIQRKIKSQFEYKVPVVIDGLVGVNFAKKVNGHYFWSLPASWLMQGKDMAELGDIFVNEYFDITIYGGPDEKITDPLPFDK